MDLEEPRLLAMAPIPADQIALVAKALPPPGTWLGAHPNGSEEANIYAEAEDEAPTEADDELSQRTAVTTNENADYTALERLLTSKPMKGIRYMPEDKDTALKLVESLIGGLKASSEQAILHRVQELDKLE